MPQYLKDEVQRRIAAAALRVFAADGFRAATMARIAREAGISAGHIYRYYENKDVLFDDVVPPKLARELGRLVRGRVKALEGVSDVRSLAPGSEWHVISRELLAFAIEHRLAVAILLKNAEGTKHEGFAEEMIASLSKLAIEHFRALDPEVRADETMRLNLEIVYRNLLGAMVRILTRFEEPALIARAVEEYARFHLAGLAALFE
jgi:AcrR family transcriptional regulator